MISKWEDLGPEDRTGERPFYEKVAWYSNLDNRYRAEVQRTEPYRGVLKLFDHQNEDKEIFSQPVGIAYDALFGPDAQDVYDWQEAVINFIDNEYVTKIAP